jgi:hypothetical protein
MLFVFCGQSPNTYQIQDGSPEAIAIQSFLEDGKNIYIEGGDVWYYDPGHGGFDFNPYFGDTAISDGTTSPVDSVIGIDGTLFDGMRFAYSGESKYSDKIDSRGCVIGFVDEGAEGIGWYYVHPTYGSRTFGFTGELSGLSDEEYPNTKEEVIKKIVGFFHTGIEEGNNVMSYKTWVYPNPVAGFCVFRYQLPKTSSVRIKIYDITGRQVRFLNEREKEKGVYDIRWNCMDMPSGVYFINFELGEKSFTRKLVAIKR